MSLLPCLTKGVADEMDTQYQVTQALVITGTVMSIASIFWVDSYGVFLHQRCKCPTGPTI